MPPNIRDMRVDPNNRLVADTLEAQWNEKLRPLAQAKDDYEAQQRADPAQRTAEQRPKIMALAADFPTRWHSPATADRDRKRLARLLLEEATLRRDQKNIVQIRFKGRSRAGTSVAPPQIGLGFAQNQAENYCRNRPPA